jgi:multidrug efflux pump subunit AcrB
VNLPRWSIKNGLVVTMAATILAVWGLISYLRISRREDPEIKIAMALVVSIYPGASAEKVEEQVTRKLEDHLQGLPGLNKLHSTSRANLSVVFVAVQYEVDTDIAWQKLRARVAEARKELPETLIGPDVIDNFGDTTAMLMVLSGADPVSLRELGRELRSELRRVSAVGDVTLYGEQPEVVYLESTAAQLARSGVTPYRVMQALKMRNLRIPAGAVQSGRYQYRVEPSGAYRSLAEIEGTILDVSTESGQPLHVRDLFTVKRELQSPPDTLVLREGGKALAVGVVMRRGFNVVQMGKEVRRSLQRFRQHLPAGVKLEVLHDSAGQVDREVSSFMENLLEGLGLVILCMGVYMGWRPALISATAIPLSVLAALALMPLLGIDLELVSIAAFIVALGMLVDDNIIVVDNIDVKLRQGLDPAEAAARGTHQLTSAIIVGTLGNCAAFLPMLLLGREVGAYTRSLPLVLSISLLASLVLALTVAPLLCRYTLRRPGPDAKLPGTGRGSAAYRRLMRVCLRHRAAVVLLSVLALGGAVLLLVRAGFSFFPEAQRDQLVVDIWLKEGTSIEETERVAKRADAALRTDAEVASTLVYVGKGGPRFYITVVPEFQTPNYAQIMVNTKSAAATRRVVDRFNRTARTTYAGARVSARKLIMGIPVEAPVALRISGPDLNVLRGIGEQVKTVLRGVRGTDDVRDNMGEDIPSLRMTIDDERAARAGITHTDVALTFLSSHQGLELTRFADGEKEIPVVLRLGRAERHAGADLWQLPVASNITGEKVPLGSVATAQPQWGPGVIRHQDSRRSLTVLAWTDGRLANDLVEEAWPAVSAIALPPGYRIDIAGEKEELDRAFRELLLVFGVILGVLVVLLTVQLGSLRRVVVVLVAVPLSIVGAALGLSLGGYSFSFMAFLGVLSLCGMVIKNGVVWVEFVDDALKQGRSLQESVIEAGIFRLRPIVLTAGTTLGGLLPLGLFGGVLFEPMAWVMIGGLAFATLLSLLVVPVFYLLLVPPPAASNQNQD